MWTGHRQERFCTRSLEDQDFEEEAAKKEGRSGGGGKQPGEAPERERQKKKVPPGPEQNCAVRSTDTGDSSAAVEVGRGG